MSSATIGPPRDDADIDAYLDLASRSFNYDRARLERVREVLGPSDFRVARTPDAITGGLVLVPMGQYFGGAMVPMTGISLVATDPVERGRGLARALMCETVRELRSAGVSLSALYPATRTLYRKAGYEVAGTRWFTTIDLNALDVARGASPMRQATESDREGIESLYERTARIDNGTLARGAFSWRRVRSPGEETSDAYVLDVGDGIEAYIYYTRRRESDGMSTVIIQDCAADSRRGAHALLSFLRDHRSIMRTAESHLPPGHPVLDFVPEWAWKTEVSFPWMLRLCDARGALEARGYPAPVEAEVNLRVQDDVVGENEGAMTLTVREGRGTVTTPADDAPCIDIDVRDLATLYAGYRSATTMAGVGAIRGPASALARLDAIFAGPSPFMPDMF